jgi:hypothetical protein
MVHIDSFGDRERFWIMRRNIGRASCETSTELRAGYADPFLPPPLSLSFPSIASFFPPCRSPQFQYYFLNYVENLLQTGQPYNSTAYNAEMLSREQQWNIDMNLYFNSTTGAYHYIFLFVPRRVNSLLGDTIEITDILQERYSTVRNVYKAVPNTDAPCTSP